MRLEQALSRKRLLVAFAIAAAISIGVLAYLGYVAVREWQRSVELLATQQAEEAAERLLTELTRDMQAAQRQVLLSPALDSLTVGLPTSEPSYEALNLVASAFARYAYPDSFFIWRAGSPRPVFFYRRDRRPAWSNEESGAEGFPVVIDDRSLEARGLIDTLQRAAVSGQRFSIFEQTFDSGRTYQFVARLIYRDEFRQNVHTAFGFVVDMNWVREHYFPALLAETTATDPGGRDVALAIADDKGAVIAASGAFDESREAQAGRRTFTPMFFNPLLVATQPAAVPRRSWTIRTANAEESSLVAAAAAADRMFILQLLAAATLAVGIVLSFRAAGASMRLAELRAEFVASVSHEFKTPIATIRAAGETLAGDRLEGVSARKDYAVFIVQEARRLTRLVDNLLAFSRMTDAIDVSLPLERVPVGEVVDQTLERFSVQLTTAGFAVDVDIPPDLPPVRGDRSGVALMLDNIVDNAIRHSRGEHRLRISATHEARHVILRVDDRGGGIPDDEIALVTKKFYRGRHAGHGGTGLGLAIASRIAANHGGALTVSSDAGVGTTISMRLPAAEDRP